MNRTLLLLRLFGLLGLLASLLAGGAAPASTPPNVLVILADDLGWADVSYHGAEDLRTPHLDALARSGVTFTAAYANSSVCSPTRASLLTGRVNTGTGMQGVVRDDQPFNTWGYWHPTVPSLITTFRENGYATAAIGKWHLGTTPDNVPNARGFDYFKGFLGGMMDDYYVHERRGQNLLRENNRVITATGHATDLFTNWTLEYLRDHAAKASAPPFFLYLAYTAPHVPIQPPPDWLARVQTREPELDPTRAGYVAMVEHMDDGIGQIVATLAELGLTDNTLILFTSDNGGMVKHGADNGPYRAGKGSMYEGGLRVPGFITGTPRIPAAATMPEVITTMDYLPTLLELCGLGSAAVVDGLSFATALQGGSPPQREHALFFGKRAGRFASGGNLSWAVRRGDLKLLQSNPFGPPEMYDVASDPHETHDLLGGAGQPPAEPELLEAYRGLFRDMLRNVQQAGRLPFVSPESQIPQP